MIELYGGLSYSSTMPQRKHQIPTGRASDPKGKRVGAPAAKQWSTKKIAATVLETKASRKSERLEARVTPELRKRLIEAAGLEGQKVSDYVTSTLDKAARETIERAAALQLSQRDAQAFVDALLNPRASVPGLDNAVTWHRELFADER